MLRPTLRARIVLWNAVIVGLILTLLAVVSYERVRSNVYKSIDDTLRSRSERLYGLREGNVPARSDDALINRGSAHVMQVQTRPRLLRPDGTSATQYGSDEAWDLASFKQALNSGEPNFAEADAPEGRVRVYSRPIEDAQGKVQFVAQHVYLLNEAEAALEGVKASFTAIAPLALIAIVLGAIILAARVANPIAQMAVVANSISAQDLDKRLDAGGADEVSTLARAFNSLLDRLHEAFEHQKRVIESQRHFIADASNELRAPLESIKGSAESGLAGATDPQASLEQIRKAAGETDMLVGQMLSLARADARLGDYKTKVEMFPLLLEVYERWEPVFGERLALEAPRRLPEVLGDERQIKEVLDNLLQNCLRYAPSASVRITAEEAGEQVIVAVEDNGPGIAAMDLERVFDRFYRGSSERHIPGAGLGLAICKEITEAHGGRITAASEDGSGATICFSLPKST
jgi:signal transduction histidine kinase